MSKGSSSENPRSTWNFLWRDKADLDRLIWLLSIDDHGLVWLHIYELLPDFFYGVQGKFLIFFLLTLCPQRVRIKTANHASLRRGVRIHLGTLLHEQELVF